MWQEKSCTRETPNLLTNADSNTNIWVSAGVQKVADSNNKNFPPPTLPQGEFESKFLTTPTEEPKLNHWVITILHQLVIPFEPSSRCI